MAITPINNRYPGFIFDGENSRDYGVYITDVEVFGAPKRKVQMISIPGRNGDYALDEGSFENIPVKYKCVLGAGTEEDFNDGISDFRNWLASKVGYKVLSDEINLGEYRKGVFLEGMEVPTLNKKTGTFDIVFDCMPQRWLDDASSLPVEMASGDDIFNPTLHKASPLLSVWGYGGINIDGEDINLANVYVGKTLISNGSNSPSYNPGYSVANAGDTVTVETAKYTINVAFSSGLTPSGDPYPSTLDAITWSHGTGAALWNALGRCIEINATPDTFLYQTASTIYSVTIRGTFKARDTSLVMKTGVYDFTVTGAVDADGTLTCSHTMTKVSGDAVFTNSSRTTRWGYVYVDSTKSALGTPTYIDLDIGESYYYNGGDIISANTSLTLPAKLPTLKPGHNTITFDNTVSKLVITPRWWKV